jgi:hypothetical protein
VLFLFARVAGAALDGLRFLMWKVFPFQVGMTAGASKAGMN